VAGLDAEAGLQERQVAPVEIHLEVDLAAALALEAGLRGIFGRTTGGRHGMMLLSWPRSVELSNGTG
jgi:hypothetical protein